MAKQKRWEKAEKQKPKRPTKKLNEMTPDRAGRCEELEERFREGVISLIREEGLWLF